MRGVTFISILLLAVKVQAVPRITDVVVYPDRAQVTRSETIPCGAAAAVRFDGITPVADPASFRAKMSRGAIEGLRHEVRSREEAFAPEVKALDAEFRKLDGERRQLQDARQRTANAVVQLADRFVSMAVGMIGGEMGGTTPNVVEWSAAFDLALAARLRAARESVDAATRLRAVERRIEDVARKRTRVMVSAARRDFSVEVLVSCASGENARVDLTYLVGGASWTPSYEARADERAARVEVSTFATVAQATGEAWTGVKLVLSTAIPRQDATPPQIRPLNVWASKREEQKKVLVPRLEERRHADAPGDATTADAETGAAVRAVAQGLSVQLVVPGAASVSGDNTPARLFVARTAMKARFAYRTVPKLMPFVFRVAELVNSAPFPLRPGAVDAFRKGGMIGRFPVEHVAQGARFDLTFGIEEGLRVKRTVVEELVRDAGFLGRKRRFRYAYRFDVANFTEREEQVELSEHIPVSELDDVKVEVDEKTTAGYETRAEDGILTWKLRMKRGEKRVVDLAYRVDAPSSYDSGQF